MFRTHSINHHGMSLVSAICLAACAQAALAQPGEPVVLQIDLQNYVQYWDDNPDTSKFATSQTQTTTTLNTFMSNVQIADVVAVNGKPAKGTFVSRTQLFRFNPSPLPGQVIADVPRSGGPALVSIEILQTDGTPVGTIMGQMLVSGAAPPGAPSSIAAGNGVIVGGTGAFLGATGQCGGAAGGTVRNASYTEDPALRRTLGGGKVTMIQYLLPAARPEIIATSGGPAVVHASDFSLVTAANPAKAGELLALFAKGLGPVHSASDPGQPFPTTPLASVNSPIDVMVNGTSADVVAAVGYPGSSDGYQVNFRLPASAAHGTASLQLSAAWIPSAAVSIAIQ